MKETYEIVRNFIPVDRSKDLSEKFKEYCRREVVHGDLQVPNAPSVHNYLYFMELLCEKTSQLNEICGEPLFPTYCYARVYGNNDSLAPHKDRGSCDISVTVNLDCDVVWPIYINNNRRQKVECLLNPGDAMVYRGIEAVHWREEFNGQECTQVFLHYVRSRGPYKNEYFDRHRFINMIKSGSYVYENLDDML